jgi:hypothetical protein
VATDKVMQDNLKKLGYEAYKLLYIREAII